MMIGNKTLALALLVLASCAGLSAAPAVLKPFAVQSDIYDLDFEMASVFFDSRVTPYRYQLDISWLPEYANANDRPVIYVTDGHWRRMDHKYVHYLTVKKIIPPVLVVGVGYPDGYDAGTLRYTDLASRPDDFLKSLKKEVIPLVEGKYRVDPGRRYLFGASLGGRFAAHSFLRDALAGDATFCGYIGSSPYLAGSGVAEMAKQLTARKRAVKKGLFLAYGALEGKYDYQIPNEELFGLLRHKNLSGLDFYHYAYPGSDHFTNTRLTLIDGLRLLLGSGEAKGIGAADLDYRSCTYDFSTRAQFYDWNTNFSTQNTFATDPARGVGGKPGSFRIDADFGQYDTLTFTTSSVYFEGLADREVRFSVHVPADLAGLGYALKFLIYSTFTSDWICDYSEEEFELDKAGWNTYSYKWRDKPVKGNPDCIRGLGIAVIRRGTARPWRGTLYVDDVRW